MTKWRVVRVAAGIASVAALVFFAGTVLSIPGNGQPARTETARTTSEAKAPADTGTWSASHENIKPDNTRVNALDWQRGGLTADQQGMDRRDRDITRQIRRLITAEPALSTYGHNIKIITRDGMVTLKGPVHSERERLQIDTLALRIVGAGALRDELAVLLPASEKQP